jgi:hypothetical protein
MSVIIELPSILESQIEDQAEQAGMTVPDFLVTVLTRTFSATESPTNHDLQFLLDRIQNPLTDPQEIE